MRVDGSRIQKKKLRIRKYPDTCGRGLRVMGVRDIKIRSRLSKNIRLSSDCEAFFLRNHQASQQTNFGRVRDQPGLPVRVESHVFAGEEFESK